MDLSQALRELEVANDAMIALQEINDLNETAIDDFKGIDPVRYLVKDIRAILGVLQKTRDIATAVIEKHKSLAQ